MTTVETLITAVEFSQMSIDSDVPLELVRGEIIEMNRPGSLHGYVCGNIVQILGPWAKNAAIGFVVSNDAGVITERDPDSVRGPDVYFVRRDRLPESALPKGWLVVPPDLCVEVLSPSDRWNHVLDKVSEYLRFGVRVVWIVDPDERRVHVYGQESAPRILSESDTLIDEEVLPSFRMKIAELFG